ncbi:MAG: hypothetical protein KDC98_13130 [Planctomycetes bacterium]|nr:hypothetical protein [Planctomycetota bacterium]
MVKTRFWSSTATVALFSFSLRSLPAQGSWQLVPTQGAAPTRAYHSGVYDLQRLRMVLFGGVDPSFNVQASTWEFDGRAWTLAAPATSPPPRGRHAMVFDLARSCVVLFGGAPSIFGPLALDDTWTFDGVNWTRCLPQNIPPARFDHAMSHDPVSGDTMMFGGRAGGVFGDTWVWNGTDWGQVAANGPAPRFRHAIAFDGLRGRAVLFGGRDVAYYQDTWEWDGVAWQQRYPANAPTARADHEMAFDMNQGVCVIHGGEPGGNETWEWDGATWLQQHHATTAIARIDHVLVYDVQLRRSTMHGGMDAQPGSWHSDVHTYGHPVAGSFTSSGASCPGSTATPVLSVPAATLGPTMGTTSTLEAAPVALHTFFAFGWSDRVDGGTTLPYDLSGYGMPGCLLQVSRDAITSSQPTNGVARVTVVIPNNPFLVGSAFFVQGFALDPTANIGGFVTTNYVRATVGRR